VQTRWVGFAIFFGIVTLLLGAAHYYVWARLVRAPALGDGWQRGGTIAIWTLGLATPAGMVLSRVLPRPIAHWVSLAIYSWFGLLVLLLWALLASELVRLGLLAGSALGRRSLAPETRLLLHRVVAAGVAGTAVLAAIHGVWNIVREVPIRTVHVVLDKLPRTLSGFRIVQLTDLHIGDPARGSWLEHIVDRTNALEPDLVAITGDLVDGSVERLRDEVASIGRLRAKHGVYFVTGNHEYYSGVAEWSAELRRIGVRVLHNERVPILDADGHGFDLVGVADPTGAGFGPDAGPNLGRALAGRDSSRELVLLAHQPREIVNATAADVGLQLSGHTHGGQMVPWNYAVLLQQPYVAGLFRRGRTQIYVSRGTGYWGPPMRIGAPAEITVIVLEAAGR
jgi:predicted MPP superfamily phosphohydrolase